MTAAVVLVDADYLGRYYNADTESIRKDTCKEAGDRRGQGGSKEVGTGVEAMTYRAGTRRKMKAEWHTARFLLMMRTK